MHMYRLICTFSWSDGSIDCLMMRMRGENFKLWKLETENIASPEQNKCVALVFVILLLMAQTSIDRCFVELSPVVPVVFPDMTLPWHHNDGFFPVMPLRYN